MKNKLMLTFAVLLCFLTVFTVSGCTITSKTDEENKSVENFYYTVYESKELLDIVADDYYSYWYDAIYNDKYNGDIDIALDTAEIANEENINRIIENDKIIYSAYKEVKDSNNSDLIKEVLRTYSDYYEFVIGISGSFNTYSAQKEPKKKALASALKNLSYEI